jgi:hypothetical protein
LARLDPGLPDRLELQELPELSADMHHRAELLEELKTVYDLARAARTGASWVDESGRRSSAVEVLPRELPWRAVRLHSRAHPFWIGQNVDGLEAICGAAQIEPPDCIASAVRLFAVGLGQLPPLTHALLPELGGQREIGAFVSSDDLPQFLAFLGSEGSRIIRAAARHGEGAACATVLRKIRECAEHAERHGLAYLEASGIVPVGLEIDPDPSASFAGQL